MFYMDEDLCQEKVAPGSHAVARGTMSRRERFPVHEETSDKCLVPPSKPMDLSKGRTCMWLASIVVLLFWEFFQQHWVEPLFSWSALENNAVAQATLLGAWLSSLERLIYLGCLSRIAGQVMFYPFNIFILLHLFSAKHTHEHNISRSPVAQDGKVQSSPLIPSP
jgi:hypothetical protein